MWDGKTTKKALSRERKHKDLFFFSHHDGPPSARCGVCLSLLPTVESSRADVPRYSPLQSASPPPRGMALDHLVSHGLLWSTGTARACRMWLKGRALEFVCQGLAKGQVVILLRRRRRWTSHLAPIFFRKTVQRGAGTRCCATMIAIRAFRRLASGSSWIACLSCQMSQGGRDNGEAFPAASASSHRAFWPRSIKLSSGFGNLFNEPADHVSRLHDGLN